MGREARIYVGVSEETLKILKRGAAERGWLVRMGPGRGGGDIGIMLDKWTKGELLTTDGMVIGAPCGIAQNDKETCCRNALERIRKVARETLAMIEEQVPNAR